MSEKARKIIGFKQKHESAFLRAGAVDKTGKGSLFVDY